MAKYVIELETAALGDRWMMRNSLIGIQWTTEVRQAAKFTVREHATAYLAQKQHSGVGVKIEEL